MSHTRRHTPVGGAYGPVGPDCAYVLQPSVKFCASRTALRHLRRSNEDSGFHTYPKRQREYQNTWCLHLYSWSSPFLTKCRYDSRRHILSFCLPYMDHLSILLSKNIGIINRSKYFLNKHSLLLLYNALVLPHISYCCLIWVFTYPSYLKKIETL